MINMLCLCIFVFSNQINSLNFVIFQHYRGQILIIDKILVGISVLSENPTEGLYYVSTHKIIRFIFDSMDEINRYRPR